MNFILAIITKLSQTQGFHNFVFYFSTFPSQYFTLNKKGEIKSEDNCLNMKGNNLILEECDDTDESQRWIYKVTFPSLLNSPNLQKI